MRKRLQMIGVLCVLVVATAGSAFGLELDEAKAKGLVGERPDGYLGIVDGKKSNDVQALVQEVNTKRKKRYQEIAKQRGTGLKVVEQIGGRTAIEKTSSGHYILTNSGWKKK